MNKTDSDNREFLNLKIIKSSRAKSPRIDVSIHGVKVVVPKGSEIDPETIIEKKREWIERKVAEFEEHRRRVPEREFEEGTAWPYLGEKYLIRVNGAKKAEITGGKIVLPEKRVKRNSFQDELEKFYRREAREYLSGLVKEWSQKIGVKHNKIYIKNQRTKWGSCSSKGNLNFNFRLIMAPPEIGEYIVIHELCHLIEPYHTAPFKRLLSEYCPEHTRHEEWLKENSVKLIFTREDL